MKYRFLMFLVLIIPAMAIIAQAEDISGEWVIEDVDSKTQKVKTFFEFEVHGSVVTGSKLGYPESELPLIDGKINGDKLTFTLKEYIGERTDRARTYMYIGKISGDTIKFSVAILLGQGIPPKKTYIARRVVPADSGKQKN
jgi:hypothetical protein